MSIAAWQRNMSNSDIIHLHHNMQAPTPGSMLEHAILWSRWLTVVPQWDSGTVLLKHTMAQLLSGRQQQVEWRVLCWCEGG